MSQQEATAEQSRQATIELPPKLVPVFTPRRGDVLYRWAYGGRGSGKSFSFALMAAIMGYAEPLRVLCTREFQVSIKESFHAELKAAIQAHDWLDWHYDVGTDYLRGRNGTEFVFRGLARNISSIKSLAKIDLTIVEEAEDVPERSWQDLEATVFRQPASEMWVIWNPRTRNSSVDARFRKRPPVEGIGACLNYDDNPFFPSNLEKLRRRQRDNLDPETYLHIWEGEYLENSTAQVLGGKWRIAELEPDETWNGPYYGVDWGFAEDPLAGARVWVKEGTLYVEYECYGHRVEIADTANTLDELPGARKYVMRADSARPEMVSHMYSEGFRIQSAEKWPGSVEDGVSYLRGMRDIVIHPRCTNAIDEARRWCFKVDRHTGDVKPELAKGNDHIWDSVRYALEPLIKPRETWGAV